VDYVKDAQVLHACTQGSKILRSEQQSYIVSPLSSIVDERYTVSTWPTCGRCLC
jgi:hypothetical protein